MIGRRTVLVLAGALVAIAPASPAQSAATLAERMVAMTAVSGFEQAMADSLLELLPDAGLDRAGNVVLGIGKGHPIRAIACPMDEAGFVVGNIRPDGFLTLRRVGRPLSRLFDQWHEGRPVTVWTRAGSLPAVVGVYSMHLARGRPRRGTEAFQVDDAYVEVGATSGADAREMGVELLNPVALTKRPHRYGTGLVAGTEAARRGACGALAHAASTDASPRGRVVIAFLVESRIGHRGIRTLANNSGPFTETVLLEYVLPDRFLDPALGSANNWFLESRYVGTPAETVRLSEVEALSTRILEWIGGGP